MFKREFGPLPTDILALDFETGLIAPGAVHPKPACLTVYHPSQGQHLLLTPWEDDIAGFLIWAFGEAAAGRVLIVNQNTPFDVWVAIKAWGPAVFQAAAAAYRAGNVLDTQTRAKFIDIQTHGGIEYKYLPDGSKMKLLYNQAELYSRYCKRETFHLKGQDTWRMRYSELEGVPKAQWPAEAVQYAMDDPKHARELWDAMTAQHRYTLDNSLEAERLCAMGKFTLAWVKQEGIQLDPVAAQELLNATRIEALDTEHLEEVGMRSPMVPSRPHSGGHQDHVPGCPKKITRKVVKQDENGQPMFYKNGNPRYVTVQDRCDCPVKLSQMQPAKNNDVATRELIRDWILSHDPEAKIPLTEGGQDHYADEYGESKRSLKASDPYFVENPSRIKIETEQLELILANHAKRNAKGELVDGLDITMAELLRYKKSVKLWTSFIPGLMWDETHNTNGSKTFPNKCGVLSWGERIHGSYDILKRTGRMSCSGDKLFPSANHQQVDPRVRSLYIADPGFVLGSTDYNSLELYSAASAWMRIYEWSKLHDLLMSGRDAHGYLGAQLAHDMTQGIDVPQSKDGEQCQQHMWDALRAAPCVDSRYDAFMAFKASDHEGDRAWFKFWRTFAKPVGLGLPGGMGAATLRLTAFSTYGVLINEDQAKRARELWLELFPEAELYLTRWPRTTQDGENKDEEGKNKYQYTSPAGMTRRGCTYTALCNGNALQTPPAEALRRVIFEIMCACWDPNSPLYGCKIAAVIHDEVLMQYKIHEDYSKTMAAMAEVERIMQEVMSLYLGIQVGTETEIMYRWRKFPPKDAPWMQGHRGYDSRRPIDPPPVYLKKAS